MSDKELLPTNWETASLESICLILDNLRDPVNNKDRNKRIDGKEVKELYPYYGATGQAGLIDDYIFDGEYVLLGEDGAPFYDYKKNTAYIVEGQFWVNNHAHILKCLSSNRYLAHYLNQFDFHGFVTGSTRLKLNQTQMKRVPVKIAPLQEQNRIVSKIEELFSELDNGVATLRATQKQLKNYRHSILKHAFEGKLTAKWREKHTDELEPVETLLEKIKMEKEKRFQQQLDDWKKTVEKWEADGKQNKKPTKPRNPKRLLPLTKAELRKLAKLPDGWTWVKFDDLAEYITSGSRGWAKYYCDQGAIFIRAQNLKYDHLELENIAFVNLPENVEGKRTRVTTNDLLITITGANVTKTGYVKHDVGEAYVSQHVALCRLVQPQLVEFLYYYIISSVGGRKQLEKAAYGAGKPGLSLEQIRSLTVPIASAEEMTIAIREIIDKLLNIKITEQTIETSLKQAEAMRRSILKAAFEGKLVPQDPDDEPASKLLEQIKSEKASLTN